MYRLPHTAAAGMRPSVTAWQSNLFISVGILNHNFTVTILVVYFLFDRQGQSFLKRRVTCSSFAGKITSDS
jgi:hypothetical protein